MVQWLTPRAFTARDMSLIPGQGTKSLTPWQGQVNKSIKKIICRKLSQAPLIKKVLGKINY